jgi:hypothetical protein
MLRGSVLQSLIANSSFRIIRDLVSTIVLLSMNFGLLELLSPLTVYFGF